MPSIIGLDSDLIVLLFAGGWQKAISKGNHAVGVDWWAEQEMSFFLFCVARNFRNIYLVEILLSLSW